VDQAGIEFGIWFDNRAAEEKVGKDTSPKLKQGQTMVRRYATEHDILALYGVGDANPTVFTDPEVARIDFHQLAQDLEDVDDEDIQF